MDILLDLDGVCVDFVSAALKHHDMEGYIVDSWNFFDSPEWYVDGRPMTPAEFWAPLEYEDFWYNLEKYPWCDELIALVESYDPDYTILTSPHNCVTSYAGKYRWIRDNLHENPSKKALIGAAKHRCACDNAVLIDDSEDNCFFFMERGGNAILFPQLWNKNKALIGEKLAAVNSALQVYEEALSNES